MTTAKVESLRNKAETALDAAVEANKTEPDKAGTLVKIAESYRALAQDHQWDPGESDPQL